MSNSAELQKPEDNTSSSKQNEKSYDHEREPSPKSEEPATVLFMNWEDFLRTEFSKVTNTAQTNADAFKNLTESNLILNKEVAFYRKITIPGPDKS
jgi:hypothetical protein